MSGANGPDVPLPPTGRPCPDYLPGHGLPISGGGPPASLVGGGSGGTANRRANVGGSSGRATTNGLTTNTSGGPLGSGRARAANGLVSHHSISPTTTRSGRRLTGRSTSSTVQVTTSGKGRAAVVSRSRRSSGAVVPNPIPPVTITMTSTAASTAHTVSVGSKRKRASRSSAMLGSRRSSRGRHESETGTGEDSGMSSSSKDERPAKRRGGRDRRKSCGHNGCDYQSSAGSAKGQRKGIRTHERSIVLHMDHFKKDHENCATCRRLLKTRVWSRSLLTGNTTRGKSTNQAGCSHLGCTFSSEVLVKNKLKVALQNHERNFKIHASHYTTLGKECKTCRKLVSSGTWKSDPKEPGGMVVHTGDPRATCRHDGCKWMTKCAAPARIKINVHHHEKNINKHRNHFRTDGKKCACCLSLLHSGEWREDMFDGRKSTRGNGGDDAGGHGENGSGREGDEGGTPTTNTTTATTRSSVGGHVGGGGRVSGSGGGTVATVTPLVVVAAGAAAGGVGASSTANTVPTTTSVRGSTVGMTTAASTDDILNLGLELQSLAARVETQNRNQDVLNQRLMSQLTALNQDLDVLLSSLGLDSGATGGERRGGDSDLLDRAPGFEAHRPLAGLGVLSSLPLPDSVNTIMDEPSALGGLSGLSSRRS